MNTQPGIRKLVILLSLVLISSACTTSSTNKIGPVIQDIATSDTVVVISDCVATSVTITANIQDTSPVTKVLLWYRVGSEGAFTFTPMDSSDEQYTAMLKGTDLQGYAYGTIEFYITAEDEAGSSSTSATDRRIQFLPCVNN
jgi:hypothetical protein